jgi:hypothetical protein
METTGKKQYGLPEGVGHELKFWKQFVKTKRFLEGWVSNGKTPELDNDVANFIWQQLHENEGCKVLDLGSGAVSILNGLVPADQLTTTDPLAELYECVFDYEQYGIKPPIPIAAELIGPHFGEFQIVHMRNALDHSQDPMLALQRMMSCCIPEGYVIIQGFANEADAENWQGMHQWNISLDEALSLCITDKAGQTFKYENPFSAAQFLIGNNKEWLIWIWKKQSL